MNNAHRRCINNGCQRIQQCEGVHSCELNAEASAPFEAAIPSPQPEADQYLIAHIGHTGKWDEHVCWWKPNSRGYTICVDKAGRYSEAEARGICQHGECIAVPVAVAEALSLTTPYFRRPNGTLARLYDGDQHRPVPNSREAWKALMVANIVSAPRWTKPTPITSARARAIYLDEVPA